MCLAAITFPIIIDSQMGFVLLQASLNRQVCLSLYRFWISSILQICHAREMPLHISGYGMCCCCFVVRSSVSEIQSNGIFSHTKHTNTQFSYETSISLLSDWNLRRIVVVTARILDIHLFIFFLVALKLTMYWINIKCIALHHRKVLSWLKY